MSGNAGWRGGYVFHFPSSITSWSLLLEPEIEPLLKIIQSSKHFLVHQISEHRVLDKSYRNLVPRQTKANYLSPCNNKYSCVIHLAIK